MPKGQIKMVDTLSSNNIPFESTSCKFAFIFDHPIIWKTPTYIHLTSLDRVVGFDT